MFFGSSDGLLRDAPEEQLEEKISLKANPVGTRVCLMIDIDMID
jgi:hypothetical protein